MTAMVRARALVLGTVVTIVIALMTITATITLLVPV
jgi:hypothetical protein